MLLGGCVAVLLCSSLFGQTATSSLTGRVTTTGDARVTAFAGRVTVIVTSKALQHERRTTTTQWGRYWLTALPPGEYEVTFSRKGLQTVTKRVRVELGRAARLDAHLEASEDEENVTATGKTVNVTETTAITTHFSDANLDRLPYRRDTASASILAPGGRFPTQSVLDDAMVLGASSLAGQEALEQVTFFRAAIPAELEAPHPPVSLTRTRSGGEEWFFSLRDTVTSSDWISGAPPNFEGGVKHLVEAALGGRIIPGKLWFFADAWRGSEPFAGDLEGHEAKLTAQLGAHQNLAATYADAEGEGPFGTSSRFDHASLRYQAFAGPRFTAEAVASRATFDATPGVATDQESLFLKTTFVASSPFGDHIVSAGGRLVDADLVLSGDSAFLNDRWVWGRATMNLGLRHDYDRTYPRAAATFDLLGNGRHAIAASLGDYKSPAGNVRELTAGYAMAIGNTGTARVDAIRRDYGFREGNGLQADFVYSLFDRFHTGAAYSLERASGGGAEPLTEHVANAWAGIDLPAGSHEFGITLVERYRTGFPPFAGQLQTDVALRYSLPVARAGFTVAVDATNVFDDRESPFMQGRAVRGWVRVRLLP
jgi:Carboxypeptidase regulatory-like domain